MKKKLLLALGIVPVLVGSCAELDVPMDGQQSGGGEVVMPLNLSCELLDTETDALKSMHDLSGLRRVSNANYYLFEDGALVGQGYYEDMEDFAVSLPSREGEYNLYILANVSKKAVSPVTAEEDMATAVHHDYYSFDGYFEMIEENGFPMAGIIEGFTANSSDDIMLRRLVHTLYVTADKSELAATDMKFTGLSIRNAARDIYPFAPESRAEHVMDGDAVSADELSVLNDGGEVTLFLLENMRGELFPGNTDWKQKIPENMAFESEREKASYIELTAEVQTATARYDRNVYRAYIGTSPADCDVRRHTYFNINNRFTNDMVVDEGWRIESDTPYITGKLTFIDDSRMLGGDMKELDRVYVMPGFTTEFYVYKYKSTMKYTLSGPDSSNGCRLDWSVEEVTPNIAKITVTTGLDWNEKFDGTSGMFRIVSDDGLLSKNLEAVIWNSPLSVTFSTEFNNMYPTICMTVNGSPLRIFFNARMKGNMTGFLSHYPKGYKRAESTRSISKNFTYEDPNETMCVNPMFFEAGAATSTKQTVFRIGTKMSTLIWKETGWNSTNKYNGNEGYDKHAYPTGIYLDIELTCSWSSRWNTSLNVDNTITYPTESSAVLPLRINNLQYMPQTHTGGGTDFGIKWTQHDMGGDAGYIISFDTADMIHVRVNGTDDWTDNPVKLMIQRK